jgi:hypothetical protein
VGRKSRLKKAKAARAGEPLEQALAERLEELARDLESTPREGLVASVLMLTRVGYAQHEVLAKQQERVAELERCTRELGEKLEASLRREIALNRELAAALRRQVDASEGAG